MVVCRYFQEGRCRFGENCKFEHQRNDVQRNLFGQSNGSTTWTSKPVVQQTAQTPSQDLVLQLPREMEVWEKSKMWPFSCIAMEGETAAIPGFYDTSAEELRCDAYQALKSGNMQPYIEKFKMLSMEYQNKRKELKNISLDVKQKLVALLEESRKKKALSNNPSMFGASTSSNPFGGPIQGASTSTSTNLFGGGSNQGTSATFGSTSQSQGSTGLFGKSAFSSTPSTNSSFGNSGNTSSSIFGNSGNSANNSMSVFGNSGNNPSSSSSVFGQSQKSTANPFASASTSSSGQGVFGGGSTSTTNTNPFGSAGSGSLFGGSSQSSSSVFGSPAQTSSSSVFGSPQKPGLLGAAPSPFGGTQPPAPGLLGVAPPGFSPQTSTSGQQTLFGTPSAAPQQTLFGKQTPVQQPTTPQTLFGKQQSAQPQPGLFGSAQSPGISVSHGSAGTPGLFGSTQSQGTGNSAGVYTPFAELTEVEKAEFMAKAFTLGRVPLCPPARELINV